MNDKSLDKMSPQQTSSRWRRTIKACLACLFLLFWFGALDERALFHPDEGRYAEIPREMVASGDWITPRLNGLKYFEKPVLQYWITKTAQDAPLLAVGRNERSWGGLDAHAKMKGRIE